MTAEETKRALARYGLVYDGTYRERITEAIVAEAHVRRRDRSNCLRGVVFAQELRDWGLSAARGVARERLLDVIYAIERGT